MRQGKISAPPCVQLRMVLAPPEAKVWPGVRNKCRGDHFGTNLNTENFPCQNPPPPSVCQGRHKNGANFWVGVGGLAICRSVTHGE